MPFRPISPELNDLSKKVIGLAIKVHHILGPGLLESSYKECLFYEIQKAGFYAEKEKGLPLIYEEVKLELGYRMDLLVENRFVIEIKAVESPTEVHTAQVLTYLRISQNRLGLLINFNVCLLKEGIKRLVL